MSFGAAPSPSFQEARSYLESRRGAFEERLFELLRIPSVSSDSRRRADTARCAERVRELMVEAGLETAVHATAGHPILYGERRGRDGAPALLIYGHYDVQPAEPLGPWRHDPFEPAIEDGNVIARGATDDKGQALSLLFGVQAAIACGVGRDISLKVLIEGEEEVGSPNLMPFVRAERARLGADAVVIADSSQLARGIPAITYGLRGLVCMEIIVRGARQDLHSGSYGGAVLNPANVLARLVAACQAPFGKVAVPGFYDEVRPLEAREREELARLPFDESAFREELGVPRLFGEEGFTTLERKWARPTFDVNGLVSGHTGEGVKTVLPCEARAKVSMRLVPDQDPQRIAALAKEFILGLAPAGVRVEVVSHHGARPVLVDRRLPAMAAAEDAIECAYGRRPVFIREGGSIPVVNTFKQELGADSLLIGLGLPDDGAHGPNEKFALDDFHRGMVVMAALIDRVSQRGS
jgi:acetylornithine deacetylase/succinyl-diaminopimelate desuccinylase-like protein